MRVSHPELQEETLSQRKGGRVRIDKDEGGEEKKKEKKRDGTI